ncbi:ornithine carbamoyltransferase [Corynebacterium sp. zg-331]|uniref:ornithine carbamoyltransferase n=1 Tax=unclassified Corynebacterium TaxID=2624378 RepID=UPI00128CDD62|nr:MULTISPECIES: ornithine carbamoyltransferase [unclassified Corynebacterium]MBC3186779.1 ornithine carbamoyltransferase [Corynebacterium sp. zg-331]MPV53260.1 ornithine carbamoyltransferase [Corynebacterium sp. zg331]
MPVSLSGRHFLTLLDYSAEEIRYLVDLARQFKALKRTGTPHRHLEGKNIVLLFEKTSTRTRCAFEVGAMDLGMGVTYLESGTSQMGKKESIKDTARVLGRMFDGIEYRGFDQSIVEELAQHAGVPVWNGLTTQFHPTQMIADLMTIEENFPQGTRGLKVVFMGDARNNVANSLMVLCATMGMHFVACGPAEQMPEVRLVETCRQLARTSGGSVRLSDQPEEAVAGAHVVYTDVWVSMGEESPQLWEQRIALLEPYRVTRELLERAEANAIFLHCLPAYHDANTAVSAQIAERCGITEMEVTDEVFEGERSRVFDEAENRLHAIKAIMYATLS